MAIFEDTLMEEDIFAFPGVSRTSSFTCVVHSWSNKEVLHWIEGIDSAVAQYLDVLERSQIDGRGLLLLDEDGIYDLGVSNFGVAKMIFQAIQLLLDFCNNVGEENLQTLCLNVCISVGHLENDMRFIQRCLRPESSQSELISLNNVLFYSVSQVVEHLKKALIWLDRSPFDRVSSFISFRSSVMQDCLSLLRAVCDPYLNKHFLETINSIGEICKNVYEKCDSIITTSFDPMICYTTFFENAILRKTKDFPAWGFNLQSSYRGVHIICEVKLLSPADACGKVDAGDEILQINGEMILGWELGKVANRLSSFTHNECCRELILLVNKRPREPTLVPRLPRPGLKLGSTTLRSFKRKRDFVHSVITEESDVIDEVGKQKSKQELSSLHPESLMTASSASTDFITGESFFDHQVHLMRRATISCGTPPPQISNSQQQHVMDRSQSLTIPLMVMGVDSEDIDEMNASTTRDFKMAEETGMQVEMVIRRRRTMRQQPGGYVRSFIDNQPISEARNYLGISRDNDADCVCTSVFVDKSQSSVDEVESEWEPDHYAVIDVVDQCDLDLMNLLPVHYPEWSSSLHLSLYDEIPDSIKAIERQESAKMSDEISVCSYTELASTRSEDSIRNCETHTTAQTKYLLSLSSSLKSNIQAPIAETDEASLGCESDGDSDVNCQECTIIAPATSAGKKEETDAEAGSSSNMLKELSYVPSAKLDKKQLEGWVRRKRLEHECSLSKWIKCWMVLREGVLYVYQNPDAFRADMVIAVAKFIVSDAPELKTSKKYVFRLCRNSSSFYFSAYKFSEMKEWMNKLGLAAICYNQTAEEREKSDTLSRSMVFVTSLDENMHLSMLSCTPSPPVHHTLPRASAGNAAARRVERVHRQNSLRSPRPSLYTVDSTVTPTTFFSSKFFKRNESFDN